MCAGEGWAGAGGAGGGCRRQVQSWGKQLRTYSGEGSASRGDVHETLTRARGRRRARRTKAHTLAGCEDGNAAHAQGTLTGAAPAGARRRAGCRRRRPCHKHTRYAGQARLERVEFGSTCCAATLVASRRDAASSWRWRPGRGAAGVVPCASADGAGAVRWPACLLTGSSGSAQGGKQGREPVRRGKRAEVRSIGGRAAKHRGETGTVPGVHATMHAHVQCPRMQQPRLPALTVSAALSGEKEPAAAPACGDKGTNMPLPAAGDGGKERQAVIKRHVVARGHAVKAAPLFPAPPGRRAVRCTLARDTFDSETTPAPSHAHPGRAAGCWAAAWRRQPLAPPGPSLQRARGGAAVQGEHGAWWGHRMRRHETGSGGVPSRLRALRLPHCRRQRRPLRSCPPQQLGRSPAPARCTAPAPVRPSAPACAAARRSGGEGGRAGGSRVGTRVCGRSERGCGGRPCSTLGVPPQPPCTKLHRATRPPTHPPAGRAARSGSLPPPGGWPARRCGAPGRSP